MMDPSDRPRLLLVEERGPLRKLLRRVLEDAGCTVHTATGIDGALEMLRTGDEPVDLLLADPATGHLGAEELADEVRRLRSDCALILVSGEAVPGFPHPERPWVRRVPRPFNLEQLVRTVDDLLEGDVIANAGHPG